jgi:nucleoside-diphosphate-sugar epimerase
MNDLKTMMILGGTGFIGSEVVAEAVRGGWRVKALTRSTEGVRALEVAGAEAIHGAAENPSSWGESASGADVLIDLVQPALPGRLTRSAIRKLGEQRLETTRGIVEAIMALPPERRPLLFTISGVDDLDPEAGAISDNSPIATELRGFAPIGVPVHHTVEDSGLEATYVYFGSIVYGAGKVFAELYVDGLKRKRAKVLGSGDNHLPLTHVSDAAGALVHLAGLPREQISGHSFLATDGTETTQRELLDETARLMGLKAPGSVPVAIASLVAGRAGVEVLTQDLRANPVALQASGYNLRYPSYLEGVPEALRRLGELAT